MASLDPRHGAKVAERRRPSQRLLAFIVSFHRWPLFGRGHGPFSPLLGYPADLDLVFVGDVDPPYRPFLVGSARVWRAADTIDPATALKRGLLAVAPR